MSDFEKSIDRVNIFCTSLKTYYELISSLPSLIERLYGSILSIQQDCCYETLEFRNMINGAVTVLSGLVD
jgi:hypothetical protein